MFSLLSSPFTPPWPFYLTTTYRENTSRECPPHLFLSLLLRELQAEVSWPTEGRTRGPRSKESWGKGRTAVTAMGDVTAVHLLRHNINKAINKCHFIEKSRLQVINNSSFYFSHPSQNLKVSSQTNFLSRAWWFPIFYFFEKNVQGSIPCCFSWPLSWPPGCFKSSCKKYSRVQKIGEDNEKST